MSGRKSSKSAGGVEEDDKKEGEPLSTEQGETMLQNHLLQKQGTLFFYKRPVYKRHEPEICRNFKKIRECPGWDSASAIFENNFFQVSNLII